MLMYYTHRLFTKQMDDGVNGEHGVHVPRRVVEVRGHDIDHVTIQHLQMVVPIALESSLR
jgi:hypothetical protein